MSKKDLVSEEVLQELINKLEEIVNNYCWNLEPFSDENINSFFDGTEEEVTYYKSLIVDSIESTSFLWSSKKIAEEIAKAIIESSKYTNNLIKNMSSIKLKYVTSLPTSKISENTIYILKASDGTSKDTLNLYNATDGWISIGEFTIDLTNYIDRTTYDTDMDLKANADEVISNDKIVQTLDSTTNSSDTILSTSGLQTEMDKKANEDDVIKKTDITTTIDSSSTDTELPTAKSVYDNMKNKNTMQPSGTMANYLTIYDWAKNNAGATCPYEGNNIADCPLGNTWGTLVCVGIKPENGLKVLACSNFNKNIYIRTIQRRNGANEWVEASWQRVCVTSVDDVPVTNIAFSDTTNYTIYGSSLNNYIVKNGICYVSLDITVISKQNDWITVYTTLPKPMVKKIDISHSFVDEVGDSYIAYGVWEDGTLKLKSGTNNIRYLCNFSYPVAE